MDNQSVQQSLDSFLSDSAKLPESPLSRQTKQPAIDEFLNSVPMPKQGMIGMSDVTAFNRGGEDAAWGALQFGGQVVDAIFGSSVAKSIRNKREELGNTSNFMVSDKEYAEAEATSADAGKFKILGNIAGLSSLPLGNPTKAATTIGAGLKVGAQAAIASAMMWDASDELMVSIKDGMFGFALGAGVGAVSKYGSDLLDGWIQGKKAAGAFVDDVENALQTKYKGHASGDTSKIIQTIDDTYQNARHTKNAMYAERDKLADQIGIKLNFDGERKSFIETLKTTQMSPEGKAALLSSQPYLPKENLSVKQAFTWMKELRTLAKGNQQNFPLKAQVQNALADTYQTKINEAIESAGSFQLKEVAKSADKYYATTYLPIKEVATYKSAEKLTEDAFIDSLIAKYPKTSAVQTAIKAGGSDLKDELFLYQLQASKQAATNKSNLLTNEINPGVFADELGHRMANNPVFAKQGKDLKALAQALTYYSDVAKGSTNLSKAVIGYGAVQQSASAGTAGAFLALPKMNAYVGFSRILASPEISTLLGQTSQIMSGNVAQPVQRALLFKTGQLVSKALYSPNLYARIGGIAGKKYSESENQESTHIADLAVGGIRG